MNSKADLKFEQPPINELVVGIYYPPIADLRSEHIGLYWNKIRDQFPVCQQQAPIGEIHDAPNEVFPLPRFWFSQGPSSILVQVQRNAFLFNWRRSEQHSYPHYESVKKLFWSELATFQNFLKETFDKQIADCSNCELTYVNIIPTNNLWNKASDIGNIIPPLASAASTDKSTRTFAGANSLFVSRFSESLSVDTRIKLGRQKSNNEIIASLELKAHGRPEDLRLANVDAWFDQAHASIRDVFLDFTAPQIRQDVWKAM